MSLHDELQRLADTAPRPDIDHTVWDRGRALRRRDRLVTSAVVLVTVLIVGGLASRVLGPPHAVAPASDTVPAGAIPSEILEPPFTIFPDDYVPPLEEDFDMGRASVAFVSMNGSYETPYATVISAVDGRYHFLSMPDLDQDIYPVALSPDGTRLAWRTENSDLHVADLTTGEVTDLPAEFRSFELWWRPDSTHLVWANSSKAGIVNVMTGAEQRGSVRDSFFLGLNVSPNGQMVALQNRRPDDLARFKTADSDKVLKRPLPADLYAKGASVTPLGWTDDHHVVAIVVGPKDSYVEGYHLALFSSPDVSESEWTYRILMRSVPDTDNLTLAYDLIPDLDGTSSQQLTHDFGEPDWPGPHDISWLIGLGVAGALSVLYGLRWLWRRRTP